MKIADLKPGDSIRHLKPYDGEGEKIIAVVHHPPEYARHALVITALSKFKGLNGGGEYLAHEVIEKYYEKVEQ